MSAGGPNPNTKGISRPQTPIKKSIKILLAGASGIPGRYILSSLEELKQTEAAHVDIHITILKRLVTQNRSRDNPDIDKYDQLLVNDFSDIAGLSHAISSTNPDIVISALNAEPTPTLDNYLIDAIQRPVPPPATSSTMPDSRTARTALSSTKKKPVFYINGFTLDLLHPSVVPNLPEAAVQKISGKTDFARRLQALSSFGQLEYCTIVCAGFIDYCLVKGYLGINIDDEEAVLYDEGQTVITGCSLPFVGDAVAQVVKQYAIGSDREREDVVNTRLRIAEVQYSGQTLLDTVEEITGEEFEVENRKSSELLQKGSIVGYLNWNGKGASSFRSDGFEFGRGTGLAKKRRTLEQICQKALDDGEEVFEGIGR